jgi:hypothetical protein
MTHAPDDVLGRYRLLDHCGGDERTGLEFWHAVDLADGHDVALTVLPGQAGGRGAAPVRDPALAGVLAVGDGLVVAEWLPSVDLGAGVLGAHLPVATIVALLRPLVDAVEAAHHAGVPAGIDSPGRVRIAVRGGAVVAFRGTVPDATTRDDVRALGAVTYLLLTGSWPVRDRDGHVVDPVVLRPDVPRDLAMVAALSLDPSLGPDIRTCGPLLRALDQATRPPPPPRPRPEPEPLPPPRPRRHRPRRRQLALAGALVVIAVAVAFGIQFAGSFGVASPSAARPAAIRPAPPTTTTTTTTPPTTTTTPPPPPAPVSPDSVREYVVSGSADNPAALSRVADGDPGTVWHTDTYRQQFPLFSPGIGIIAGFPRPVDSVTITSPSAGTVVQLRSAAGTLADTRLLATATLHAGRTTVAVPATGRLLVWIVRLDQTTGGFQSQIADITGRPAR